MLSHAELGQAIVGGIVSVFGIADGECRLGYANVFDPELGVEDERVEADRALLGAGVNAGVTKKGPLKNLLAAPTQVGGAE
jgi:hypothetical protein